MALRRCRRRPSRCPTSSCPTPAFWLADRDHREAAFRTLRDTPGLQFFDEWVFADSPFPPGPGYLALARHEDVLAASRNPQLFCSGEGVNIGDLPQSSSTSSSAR